MQRGPDIEPDLHSDEPRADPGADDVVIGSLEPLEVEPTSSRIILPLRYGARRPISEPERAADTAGPQADRSAGRKSEVVVPSPPLEPSISPKMTAVFGGLFGLATVASVVALLIQVFPVVDQRAITARAEQETTTAPSETPSKDRPGPVERKRTIVPGPWRVSELKGSHKLVTGVMQRRSFLVALEEAGVPKSEAYRILKAFEGTKKFDRSGPKDSFLVALDPTKKIIAFEYEESPLVVYQARTGDDGLLRGEQLDMKVSEEEFATSFYIGPDLAKSYRFVGLEAGLEAEINRALSGRTSVEAFEEGGTVKVIAVETTALGRFAAYARLRAIEYRPPDPAKETIRAYWFQGREFKGYVDDKGRKPSERGWRSPVPGAPITSHFNPKRMHPVLKTVMPHNGTDFGAPTGTPIYAANRGTVTFVGMQGASGNLVLIDHPDGVQTGYAHLSKFAAGLKPGDKVGTRQLIGYVGSTGRSTGPHLHFSAKKNGTFFDPLELKLDALHLMPVTERSTFLEQKAALDGALERIALPEPPPPEPAEEEPVASRSGEAGAAGDLESATDDEPAGGDERSHEDSRSTPPVRRGQASDEGDDLLGDDLTAIE